jgi:DivIVA domain-containing protein
MLSAVEVLNQKFAATKFREGYDQDEVDDFLDRVVETLKELEGGPHASRPVTTREIGGVRFAVTKWREGYDQREVDDLLDRVRERLTTTPTATAAAKAPAWQPTADAPLFPPSTIAAPPAPTGAPIPASVLVTRLQMMWATRPLGAPDVVTVRLPDGTLRTVTDLASTADGVELVLG